MAGPLMPQWVMRSAPWARSLVPGIETMALSTTVPMRLWRRGSSMLNVKREGTQPAAFGVPPMVTAMKSWGREAGSSMGVLSRILTPRRRASRRKQSMMARLSCAWGKTH